MRFLIDADLPRNTRLLLNSSNHDAVDVRDIGLGQATDPDIAASAKTQKLCLLTAD